jgi:hypothetical protein
VSGELRVQGPPGIAYEAAWGRKSVRSPTFIGRVYERVSGGGVELWHCDHKHPGRAEAEACALAEAREIAARELAAYDPPDPGELFAAVSDAFPGIPVIFGDAEGT